MSTISDSEWTARALTHGQGIDTATASRDSLLDYIETKKHIYEYQNLMDYNLWIAFSDDFENFTLDTFKKLPIETKAGL